MSSVGRKGDRVLSDMSLEDAHSLCVALEDCPCKMPKSNRTTGIRHRFRKALARAIAPPIKKKAGE